MKVLIVHAHPEPKSYCTSLKDTAIWHFSANSYHIQTSDLYKMNFNPVGGKHDFTTLQSDDYFKYQAEQLYALENNHFSKEITTEIEKLRWADLVIFNFPLWWFSMPAIMKGWIDRVFVMGLAYGSGRMYTTGMFKDKMALMCITTGAPESFFSTGGRHGDINHLLYHINHGVFHFTGMKVLPPFVAFGVAQLTDNQRTHTHQQYINYLKSVESLPSLY